MGNVYVEFRIFSAGGALLYGASELLDSIARIDDFVSNEAIWELLQALRCAHCGAVPAKYFLYENRDLCHKCASVWD